MTQRLNARWFMYIYQHHILHELCKMLLVILLLWLDLCSGIIAVGINDDSLYKYE